MSSTFYQDVTPCGPHPSLATPVLTVTSNAYFYVEFKKCYVYSCNSISWNNNIIGQVAPWSQLTPLGLSRYSADTAFLVLTFALDASNCLEIVLPSWQIGQPFRKAMLNFDATWLRSDMYWEKKMYEGSVANLGSAFNNRLLKYFVIEIFLVLSTLSPYCPVGNKVRNAFCSDVLSLKNGTGLLPSEGVIEYICSKDCCIVSGNIEISVGCKNESKFSPQCIWGTIFASWPISEQVFFFYLQDRTRHRLHRSRRSWTTRRHATYAVADFACGMPADGSSPPWSRLTMHVNEPLV